MVNNNHNNTGVHMKKLNVLFTEDQHKQIEDLSVVMSKSDIARVALEIGLNELMERQSRDGHGEMVVWAKKYRGAL